MGQKIAINRTTNANIYIDGSSFLGRAEEFSLPTVKTKTSEHKAIGMIATMEHFSGIEKMEMKIKWNSFYADVLKKNADFTKTVNIQIRASVEEYNSAGRGAESPMVLTVTAQYKDFPLGNFKQHDNVELETTLNVLAFKQEINGEEIIEIDIMANIYKANGVDLMAKYRANLGI
jgi:hypothetical protein